MVMTDDSSHTADAFTVGAVLRRSFSTFFKHPFVFWGLGLLYLIPEITAAILMLDPFIRDDIVPVISAFLRLVAQGAVAYAVFETLKGRSAPFGRSLTLGIRRLIPMFFCFLPFGILMMIFTFAMKLDTDAATTGLI
jgi:hypothetical protein